MPRKIFGARLAGVPKRILIRKNDNVKVISGKDKGKTGRVLDVIPERCEQVAGMIRERGCKVLTYSVNAMEADKVVEAVQKGILSRFYRHGRYSVTREQGTHHFHRIIAGLME